MGLGGHNGRVLLGRVEQFTTSPPVRVGSGSSRASLRLFLVAAFTLALVGVRRGRADARPRRRAPAGYGRGAQADAVFAPGQVVVQFRSDVSASARGRPRRARDAQAARTLGRPGLVLVRLGGGTSVPAAVAAFQRDPTWRLPSRTSSTGSPRRSRTTRDFGLLWGLNQSAGDHDIDAPEAWASRPVAPM